MRAKPPRPRFAVYLVPGVLLGFALSLALAYAALTLWNEGELPQSRRFSNRQTEPSAIFTLAPATVPGEGTVTEHSEPPTDTTGGTEPVASMLNIPPALTAPAIDYPGYDPLDSNSPNIVPAMPMVDDAYFSDAVFVGNSIVGLQMLSGTIRQATYYTRHSLQVESYFTQPIRIQGGEEALIPDALSRYKYKKVYLMLGVNEMSWPHFDELSRLFDLVVKNLKETQPEAIIYIQSVLPVEASLDEKGFIPNNALVQKMNRAILAICEQNDVWFLNVAEALYDENGVLPAGSTNDGTHFGSDTVKKWDDYMRTHAIPVDLAAAP